MKRLSTTCLFLLLLALAVVVSACTSPYAPTAVPTAADLPTSDLPAADATAAEPAATQPAPEEMPTAVPLWTATYTPQPAAPASTPEAPAGEAPLDAAVVAMVNGIPLQRSAFDAQLAQAETYFVQQPGFDPASETGQQSLLQLREQVLGWLIDQMLIQQAAAAQGVVVSEATVETEVRRIRGTDLARYESWLSANGLTEETLREQLRIDLLTSAMRDRVTAGMSQRTAQVHARHILLSSAEAANAALASLQGGADFIALAREISEDETTRASGGDLGFVPRGVMPPAFDEAAFAMQAGEISGVVNSDYGFHIIQVVKVDSDREVPEELWPVVQQRAFDDWLLQQRNSAAIRIDPNIVRG